MLDYLVAGAASIGDIPQFMKVARQAGMAVELLENAVMLEHIPTEHRSLVTCREDLPNNYAPVIPLNEFWVTQAIRADVPNISPSAFQASRSKLALSAQLAESGLRSLHRRYLKDVVAPYPARYLARLDAGYSGYGVVRHIEAGGFDPMVITKKVQGDASGTMLAVLDDDSVQVVVEDYLDGEEYSADVFVRQGSPVVLRLFRKIVTWIRGRPVCDSYIAIPLTPDLCTAISDWSAILFSKGCTSFGQFDLIVVDGQAIPIDFSCRIGGGLSSIKRFSGLSDYVAIALSGGMPSFPPFTVQKNILALTSGRLANFSCQVPQAYQVAIRKKPGDLLTENVSSANARVAEICFTARDFNDAVATSEALNAKVCINVHN